MSQQHQSSPLRAGFNSQVPDMQRWQAFEQALAQKKQQSSPQLSWRQCAELWLRTLSKWYRRPLE